MEEANDVQALEKISSEVDESQIKVILSTQCIKAQAFLLDKLKKQAERHKETCSFINSANMKVQAEIKQAEQEIRSMLIAQETIKSGNVEIRKELLLAKYRKADIIERVTDGVKKYEALWSQCKTRYESIPFVQKLLQAVEKQKITELTIVDLDKQITKLYDDMDARRKTCAELDNIRCIELANFMVNKMPSMRRMIKEKSDLINNMNKEIEQFLKEQGSYAEVCKELVEPAKITIANENIKDVELLTTKDPNSPKSDDDPLIPKLKLDNFDLDVIDVNFEQMKLKKDEILKSIPTSTPSVAPGLEKNIEHFEKTDYDYNIISPYFKPIKEDKTRNFSERKLINILEDINIKDGDVYNIVTKVNPQHLKAVDEIAGKVVEYSKVTQCVPKDKDSKTITYDNIEEIDLTSSNVENIIIPPTQFLDMTATDNTPGKRVSFDIPSSVQISEIIEDKQDYEANASLSVNETVSSQLDVSATSDESFQRIKDMLLKQHNLDLSPQFVYAKNNVLNKKNEDIITSKFFQSNGKESESNEHCDEKIKLDDHVVMESNEVAIPQEDVPISQSLKDHHLPMEVDETVVSSPKLNKENLKSIDGEKLERPVSGLLFTHGAQAIPDSLNVSLSTTGYEESDFPHCIDSSLLLSPKADIPATGDNQEVVSQDIPNFLSGFRKSGLAFFGGPSTSSEPKPDSSEQNDGNKFNFNFGGDKKSRGGLFNFFH